LIVKAMPKDRSKHARLHAKSAPIASRILTQEGRAEPIELGALAEASGNEILKSLAADEAPLPKLSKKDKQQIKHDAWMERLASQAPYSKSHARRVKRKAKESLTANLSDMRDVLETLEIPLSSQMGGSASTSVQKQDARSSSTKKIGEGAGQPLSKRQRQKALATEQVRLPLIMANSAFSANPFATIRTHAQNTLVKHEAPSKVE